MPNLGWQELLIVLFIVVIIFGAGSSRRSVADSGRASVSSGRRPARLKKRSKPSKRRAICLTRLREPLRLLFLLHLMSIGRYRKRQCVVS